MNIEETIRQIVKDELRKQEKHSSLTPVAKFCEDHNVSRVTLWRAEKKGRLKTVRIGRKVFVDDNQFK